MHALNSWLRAVRADGLVLVRTRVAGPWGFAVQRRDAAVFHFVAEGRAFVRQPDAQSLELRAGGSRRLANAVPPCGVEPRRLVADVRPQSSGAWLKRPLPGPGIRGQVRR